MFMLFCSNIICGILNSFMSSLLICSLCSFLVTPSVQESNYLQETIVKLHFFYFGKYQLTKGLSTSAYSCTCVNHFVLQFHTLFIDLEVAIVPS